MDKDRLRLRKSLGQNILIDENALKSILDAGQIENTDCVLEIGSGPGNLSRLLAQKAKEFHALEKDKRFEPILKNALQPFKNTKITIADILDFNLKDIFAGKKIIVIGNIPFYITTPILTHLLEQKEYIKAIIITVQKEVAARITALNGSKDYGRLTCLVQFFTAPAFIRVFPKELFSPCPKVDSALIRLKILDKPSVAVKSEKFFFDTVKALFAHRRKTLLNSILTCGGMGLTREGLTKLLEELKLPYNIRGEQLSLQEIGALSDLIFKNR